MKQKSSVKSFFEFGERIDGLELHGQPADYPVLNERAVRAGAGIMLVMAGFAFAHAALLQNLFFIKILIVVFLVEFGLRIFLSPKVAPIAALGSFIVRKQKPDYVGAIQKRFAWSLGFLMALSMLIIVNFMGIRGVVPLVFCLVCLLLLWFETSFGICLGCKIYDVALKFGWIKHDVKHACPGRACAIPNMKIKK
jgi:hypothetical protein